MKIAVIGANGKAGSWLVKEAMDRGHFVTAIVRNADKAPAASKVIVKDLFDLKYENVANCDIIIDAFGAWTPDTLAQHSTSLKNLCDLLSGKNNRLLVVGGAGSLYVNPEHTIQLMDTAGFPAMFKPLAAAMGNALAELRARSDVKWTFLSPAADFRANGARTGKYIVGGDELTFNSKGESTISYADYAMAMIDEAESGKHIGKRFTVAAD